MICDPLKICQHEGLRPESFQILAQQLTRLVAKVETDFGSVVLKADTTPNDATWDARNIKLLASANFPVQKILAQGEDPVSYIILSWIEGEPLSIESPLAAQFEAGQLLYRIHHLENRPPYEREYGWDAWMKGWLDVVLPWWGKQEGVKPQAVEAAWRGFESLKPLLAARGNQYMLQDGRPEHFLIQEDRIVGLIDVHDGQAGDGGMDLGVIGVFDEPLLKNMLKGYQMDKEEQEALDHLIPFYVFLRRLAAAEWHSRFGSTSISKHALKLANTFPLK